MKTLREVSCIQAGMLYSECDLVVLSLGYCLYVCKCLCVCFCVGHCVLEVLHAVATILRHVATRPPNLLFFPKTKSDKHHFNNCHLRSNLSSSQKLFFVLPLQKVSCPLQKLWLATCLALLLVRLIRRAEYRVVHQGHTSCDKRTIGLLYC